MPKCLVVSAVNFSEGGPLTVLRDCLYSAAEELDSDWQIVALVHDSQLIQHPSIRCIAYPQAKRSWLKRLWFEWVGFNRLSLELKPDLWLSLHDITPRVRAGRQAVYCHNPAPFYRLTVREAWLEPTLLLFNWFYGLLYGVNIHRNHTVVVQQDWLRDEFKRRYHLANVLVAHPANSACEVVETTPSADPGRTIFLYPALPRVFKNFEVLCEAAASLPAAVQARLEIRLTLDGTENRYARELVKHFAAVSCVRFIGRQSRADMARQYAQADVVLFPSKLETWGLPITEAKFYGKPLLVADLPYAHETVGTYDRVTFLPPENIDDWHCAIAGIVNRTWMYMGHECGKPVEPYAEDWTSLWERLSAGA